MAYYRITDLNAADPPPDPPGPEVDPPARKAIITQQVIDHKAKEDHRKAQAKDISDWGYVVVRNDTNMIVCVCQGQAQAMRIAGLLEDRPQL